MARERQEKPNEELDPAPTPTVAELPRELAALMPPRPEGAAGVPSVKAEVFVFHEDGKGWAAVCPDLHGLRVGGLNSAREARSAMSATIGRIGASFGSVHKPIPWKRVDFTPPEGAIRRVFLVGQISPENL